MNEVIEKKVIGSPCITEIARGFNGMAVNSTIQGMRKADNFNRRIVEAELAKKKALESPVIEEEPIPTGEQIRKDREQGEYR